MKSLIIHPRTWSVIRALAFIAPVVLLPQSALAQTSRKNPASKIYVADMEGQSQINTGEKVEDLTKKSVYTAQGTIIETKPDATNAMVYSNGTGIFFAPETRVEVKRFVQEPFTPNRSDMETEPSISQTQAFLARGSIGLCTSKLVAGSSMTYVTPAGTISIHRGKLVIETGSGVTKISVLEGDGTVRVSDLDSGGQILHEGEQAIIRTGPAGQPNSMQIDRIPPKELPPLEDKVTIACNARKTVYFEAKDKQPGAGAGAEISAVPVVPVALPTEITVSPSRLNK